MSVQRENQTLIESFEDDSSGLWVPKGPVITHQSLSTPPHTPAQGNTKLLAHVQVDKDILFNNKTVNRTVIEKGNDENTNENEKSDTTLNYSYSLLDRNPPKQPKEATPASSDGKASSSPGDLSQSLFSETSSPLRNNCNIVDRFNGILYHEHHFNGQISIVFSSSDLYNRFIEAIDKELHAKKINEVRSNYTTHIRGKGCTLITDSEQFSISASGQGSKLWREIVFTRMAIHLYEQFTKDMDSEISMSSPQSFNMTSTPSTSMTTKAVPSPKITPVTIKPNETGIRRKIVDNKQSLSELSSHVAELSEISRSLQHQLSLVNSKIDALLERSGPSCSKSYDTFITLSKTNENDVLNIIPGGSSYSDIAVNNTVKSRSNSDNEGI